MRIGRAAVPSGSAARTNTPHAKTEYRDAVSTYLQSTGRPYRRVRPHGSRSQSRRAFAYLFEDCLALDFEQKVRLRQGGNDEGSTSRIVAARKIGCIDAVHFTEIIASSEKYGHL